MIGLLILSGCWCKEVDETDLVDSGSHLMGLYRLGVGLGKEHSPRNPSYCDTRMEECSKEESATGGGLDNGRRGWRGNGPLVV